MSTVSSGLAALGLVICISASAAAEPAAELIRLQQALQIREREESLLHQPVDLSAVRCWSATGKPVSPQIPAANHLAVINLWSIRCGPCKDEFPLLRRISQEAKRQQLPIEFWFIADPPDETSEVDVRTYWQQAAAQLPDALACRSSNAKLRSSLAVDGVPITLLIDGQRVIRQAFYGSILGRNLATPLQALARLRPWAVGPKSAPGPSPPSPRPAP